MKPNFTARVENAWERAGPHLALALVPVITALFNTEKIEQTLQFDGQHIGLKLGLPASVVDLWQFTSVPQSGVQATLGLPTTIGLALIVIPLVVVIKAVLVAGYFGSLADIILQDGYDFEQNIRTYFLPFLVYELVPLAFLAPFVLVVQQSGTGAVTPLFLVLLPAILVASYLFFATPYLVVLTDRGLLWAAKRSYKRAVQGGPYFEYALRFAGAVVLLSIFVTAIVVNLGVVGIALGLLGTAPLGLTLNLATMQFVAELEGTPTADGRISKPRSERHR